LSDIEFIEDSIQHNIIAHLDEYLSVIDKVNMSMSQVKILTHTYVFYQPANMQRFKELSYVVDDYDLIYYHDGQDLVDEARRIKAIVDQLSHAHCEKAGIIGLTTNIYSCSVMFSTEMFFDPLLFKLEHGMNVEYLPNINIYDELCVG